MDSSERFSGLSNQGATCYMNSLLQTLFMTPEFLSRIYQWRWDESRHSSKKLCIPYQLQLMFAKLHLKHSPVVETTGLTTSFQWDLRECLQQHDVQEFCRVLFDAIEESVKDTDQEKMITELYEGTYVDYVKCLQCGNESIREDKFLDLSLAVRGLNEYNDSLEKALKGFIKPDMLCGDNKYFCETCNEKTDAKKGLKFSKIPYILAIQLKRFDLDYATMQRKKINDRVTFPLFLNMEKAMEEYEDTESQPEKLTDKIEEKDSEKSSLESLSLSSCKEIYELFSIMIHSGSALGGHYMAYIKSFSSGKWFMFNDSIVREIEEKELDKAIGGSVGNGIFGSNAYMFMYRKKSEDNLISVDKDQIPDYLKEDIQDEEEEKFRLQRLREERQLLTEVQIFSSFAFKLLSVNKTFSLENMKKMILNEWKLEIDELDVRFRKYDYATDQLLETFDGKEHLSIETLEITTETKLWLETKLPDEDFLHYDPFGLHLKICVWREQKDFHPLQSVPQNPYKFTVPLGFRLRDLLSFLSKHFQCAFDNIRLWKTLILNKFNDVGKLKDLKFVEITDPKHLNSKLLNLKVSDGFVILMEEKTVRSKWKEYFMREHAGVYLMFNYPNVNMIGYTIYLDKDERFGEVKKKIAENVGVDGEVLVIRKGSQNGVRVVDEEQSLSELGIYNHCTLFLDIDPAAKFGVYSVRVFYSGLALGNYDCEWHTFYELFTVNISKTTNFDEFKDLLRNQTMSMYPSMMLRDFRIREKVDRRLLGVFNTLEMMFSKKSSEISIEEDLDVNENQVVCLFRHWNPLSWELSPPVSINVDRNSSLEDLEYLLWDRFDVYEELEITRITYLYNFIRGELKHMNWIKMKGQLCKSPMFVEMHGCCFV